MEATALHKRGWTISAIARHLGRDRKTIRAHLTGEREAGTRSSSTVDEFDRFEPYVRRRLGDDPHVWATALFDEVRELGFERSYQTFTRKLRQRDLRPHCEPCAGVRGRPTIEIEHPPGEEIQWDWVELPETPWREPGHLLVGSLPHSGRFRGVFCEAEDLAHLAVGIDAVLRRLGGTARRWRVDRMATVIVPGTSRLQASFAPVAKHYGVGVDPCPPRRANRKGSVEKSIHYLAQRWWRTARVTTMAQAQADFDRFCMTIGDRRRRGHSTVGDLADAEVLMTLPEHLYPVTVIESRVVGSSALVSFRGNRYSTPPQLAGATVEVRWRAGTETIDITSSNAIVASHRRAPDGAGAMVRTTEHAAALECVVLEAFDTAARCLRKVNRPPSDEALALASEIAGDHGRDPVIDLDRYQRLIEAAS